ncbi:MAG: hypothetical protein ACI88A_000449 [Paraglaciecola sp.]|jgi:hypothetical protein
MLRSWLIISSLYFCHFTSLADEPVKAKSVTEFTQGMQYKSGFFDFYYKIEEDKVFLKIENFDQPFLFQSSMPQGIGSNDIGLDRGQLGDTRLVKFERYGNKVMLKQLNTQYRASSLNLAEQASIDEAFADSVIAGLPVVAVTGNSVLVDYTEFLLSDIHQISVQLSAQKQGDYKTDEKRSGVFLPRSKAFPDNVELEALVTFAGTKPGEFVKQVSPDPNSISVHLHHSLIRLPDSKYQTRKFVPYSGFWSVSYDDYSAPLEKNMTKQIIPRHRLSKKNASAVSSEALEPIIYYLDPGIPEPIRSALRDGALWWNSAFEAIGYKNAFQVEILPAGADPMDVRYNVIQWVHRATRGWSYGSTVIDPRTGEIIKGHVTLGSLRVRQDYLIALALTSPFSAEDGDTSDQKAMALARIRQLSAHEVGHTLGLAHNFAGSEYGDESVMDYPHPYVTIKDAKINLQQAYSVGLGAWDNYVIAYGYQQYSDTEKETLGLRTLVQQVRDKGMAYQSDPDARPVHAANATGHLWDNGKDPIAELERVSTVRKFALQKFGLDSIPTGRSLSSLEETLVPIYLLHRYQLDAVVKLIGGVNYQYELKGDYDSVKGVQSVDANTQSSALNALLKTISVDYLRIPESIVRLIPPKAYGESRTRESFQGRTGLTFDPISAAESAAGHTLNLLLQAQRLNRIAEQHDRDNKLPGVDNVLDVLFSGTLKSRSSNRTQLAQRINYLVLDTLVSSLSQELMAPEVRGAIQAKLLDLHSWLKNKKRDSHSQIMGNQLDLYWQTGEWKSSFKLKPLPPGSPI